MTAAVAAPVPPSTPPVPGHPERRTRPLTVVSAPEPAASRGRPPGRRRDHYDDAYPLLAEIAELDPHDPRRHLLRGRVIERCLPLADHIARRFRSRGESLDDLEQVARLALVKAVDRFDPRQGAHFVAFAAPTITGEIRRHFRDTAWSLRVPRALKERHLALTHTCADLTRTLGRAPTATELGAALELTREEVAEGLRAADAYNTLSTDHPLGTGSDDRLLSETVGSDDFAFDRVDDQVTLQPVLAALPDLERTCVVLRFYGNLTQSQIATRIGVSQMQVSRLLSRALHTMRDQLD
ncbi:SigB/SigF/SigG family RNA polymerase sigma factor [Rhodococcus sp. T2V]|uniref:SigB/SigF/SigG family RNA polymerase sigma factor n=1 Tax=Rhodococcus sp. T2V TaxID=3034164 RepID=UPI0023E29B49|nr:SigB/SigF/SigG family RNA polymerase sigma factor [Rhodococcus sp. T2V]MDF3313427.1 SigB/SigF/SigG family RNA polymerase sigma factor [Rhodococcus sp. T2V]